MKILWVCIVLLFAVGCNQEVIRETGEEEEPASEAVSKEGYGTDSPEPVSETEEDEAEQEPEPPVNPLLGEWQTWDGVNIEFNDDGTLLYDLDIHGSYSWEGDRVHLRIGDVRLVGKMEYGNLHVNDGRATDSNITTFSKIITKDSPPLSEDTATVSSILGMWKKVVDYDFQSFYEFKEGGAVTVTHDQTSWDGTYIVENGKVLISIEGDTFTGEVVDGGLVVTYDHDLSTSLYLRPQ
ncbi:hypothetical protein [Halobacillus litoralis]|uniref:hypothetical protein n=1 Tax=Halobacillus litoralis TaxID=45668 RepID=UPI001CFEC7C7|nr:hypothetical protein [Halobacillus litoralis]